MLPRCRLFVGWLLWLTPLLLLRHGAAAAAAAACPCDDETLCHPIAGPSVRDLEIFGFVAVDGGAANLLAKTTMNWTHITTVAWVDPERDPAMMCQAHAHGARVILAAPPFALDHMILPTHRAEWIQKVVNVVQEHFADGIVFDYENPQDAHSVWGHVYALLIAETKQALHAVHDGYQVSTCVPWSPDNIDGRNFPWTLIAQASDLLYVMDYDTQSQIFDACVASANAPFYGMVRGIQRYLDLGIAANKLVLGVPWYGYRYLCLPGTAPNAVYCPIKAVPFRGVPCSDAAGAEIAYHAIRNVLATTDASVTGGLRWDTNMGAPFFNSVVVEHDGNQENNHTLVYQYWFDNAPSLSHKFAWARNNGLRGVGPYTFSYLDPHGKDADMWSTFDIFLHEHDSHSMAANEKR